MKNTDHSVVSISWYVCVAVSGTVDHGAVRNARAWKGLQILVSQDQNVAAVRSCPRCPRTSGVSSRQYCIVEPCNVRVWVWVNTGDKRWRTLCCFLNVLEAALHAQALNQIGRETDVVPELRRRIDRTETPLRDGQGGNRSQNDQQADHHGYQQFNHGQAMLCMLPHGKCRKTCAEKPVGLKPFGHTAPSPAVRGKTTPGIVARSRAEGDEAVGVAESERLVEPRVQPIFKTTTPPAAVHAHRGKPEASKGAESAQISTRAPGSSASTRASHSVIWALPMAVAMTSGVAPVQAVAPTLRQYEGVVAVSGELNDPI